MALQIWLPGIDGTVTNYGLMSLPSLSYNDFNSFTGGKIGSKAISGVGIYHLTSDILPTTWSIACWVKFTSSYTQWNNIILCLNDSDSEDAKFYLSIVSNSYLNIGRGGSDGLTYSPTGGFVVDTWYHIAASFDGSKTYLYLNGSLVNSGVFGTTKTALNLGICCRSTNNEGTSPTGGATFPINDIRIYDHCLSPKEVKEIAKGLVLHYKLDDPYVEGTTNLASQTYISGWNNAGDCSRTDNDTTLISPCDAPVFSQTQTVEGQSAFCVGMTDSAHPSKTLTASTWFYRTGDTSDSTIGPYMRDENNDAVLCGLVWNGVSGYRNWPKDKWIYITGTFTTGSNASVPYFCSYTGALNEKFAFSGWQIEEKDHATPYTPSARAQGIVSDCSGYGRDGTEINGSLIMMPDSARYEKSTKFDGSSTRITVPFNYSLWGDEFTISAWLKSNVNSGEYLTAVGNELSNGGIVFGELTGTNILQCYLNATSGGGDMNICSYTSFTANTWYHLVYTVKNALSTPSASMYINGELIATRDSSSVYGEPNLPVYIGCNGTYRHWNGNINDFRIYTTAISADDVKDLYQTAASIHNTGMMETFELVEDSTNIAAGAAAALISKTWTDGLSNYNQSNCQCTLTDDGYRIYRPANLTVENDGYTMWGGFVLNNGEENRFKFQKGHTYMIQFEVKGQTSNSVTSIYWTNLVGWGGGGLSPTPSNEKVYNPITSNYNNSEWKTFTYIWTINDDIYKVCTDGYSSYITGNTYMSYTGFKFGFDYIDTGALGTDLYIRNIRMFDVSNIPDAQIEKNGITKFGCFTEETLDAEVVPGGFCSTGFLES